MTAWAAKRFWAAARPAPVAGGHGIFLDGKPVNTPARALLVLPTALLAEAVAAEWEAQAGAIRPETMPLTRAANSAIDRVAPRRGEVAAMLAEYAGSDLLCYRAGSPPELAARQARAWDPLLAWAAGTLGAPLAVGAGIVHVPQPAGSLAACHAILAAAGPFRLAALHDLVALSGSLVLGLAVDAGRLAAEEAWPLSRLDEEWQAEQWGRDEEAEAAAAARRAAFLDAARLLMLLEGTNA